MPVLDACENYAEHPDSIKAQNLLTSHLIIMCSSEVLYQECLNL